MNAIETAGDPLSGWRARYYDVGNALFGVTLVNRRHLRIIELRTGERLLDVGCGTASILRALHRQYGDAVTLRGIDPSPDILAVAKRKLRGAQSVQVALGAAENLPFAPDSFDWVVSCLTTHHLPMPQKEAMIRECRRVLRPGGRLVITDFGAPTTLFGRLAAWKWRDHSYSSDNMRDVVVRMIRESGFRESRTMMQAGVIQHVAAVK